MWYEPFRFEFGTPVFQLDLAVIGDWQIGSSSCCLWKIDREIDELVERTKFYREHLPWAKTAVMSVGDLGDEDRPSTRMARAAQAAERPEVAKRDAKKHVLFLESEILPRLLRLHEGTDYGLLGGVAGHHWTFLPGGEEVAGKTYYTDVEYLYARLEKMTGKPCKYLGQMAAFVDFNFTRKMPSCNKTVRDPGFVQHGEGGGQTKSSTVMRLDRTAKGFHADWFLRGHDCQLLATKTDQLAARESRGNGEGGVVAKTKAFLNLGSQTMGYETTRGSPSYIEQGMMTPTTQGGGTMRFLVHRASEHEDPNGNLKVTHKIEI